MYYKTADLHEQYLHWTSEHLRSEKLLAGHAKCVFSQTKVEHLGHIFGGGVIAVDSAKMRAIMD